MAAETEGEAKPDENKLKTKQKLNAFIKLS